MEDWLKNTSLTIDKIRLRTSSLKVVYMKACHQLNQKKLLGANLQEVDFEQLHIENKHLAKKIEKRNLMLLELKKINGGANLLLSTHKKVLQKSVDELKSIKQEIKFTIDSTAKLDKESEKVSIELDKVKLEYDKLRDRIDTYRVNICL